MSRIKDGRNRAGSAPRFSPPPPTPDLLWPVPPSPEEQLRLFASLTQTEVVLRAVFTVPNLEEGEELDIPFLSHALPTGFVPISVPNDHYFWLQVAGMERLSLSDTLGPPAIENRVHVLLEAAQAMGLLLPEGLLLGAGRIEYHRGLITGLCLTFALATKDGEYFWIQVGRAIPSAAPDSRISDGQCFLQMVAESDTALDFQWDLRENAEIANSKWEEAQKLKREAEAEREAVKREREEFEREKQAVVRYSAFPATALELLRNTPTAQKSQISRAAGYGNQFAIFENPDDQKIALRLVDEIEKGNKQAWYLQIVPTRDETLALVSVVTLADQDMKPYVQTDAASGEEVRGFLVPYDQARLMEGMGFERQQKSDGRFRFQDKEKRRLEKALAGLEDKKTHIVQAYSTQNEQGKTVRRFVKTNVPISLVRQIELAEIEQDSQTGRVPRAADYKKFLFLPAELFVNPRYAQIPRNLGLRIKQIETDSKISRREHTPVFLLGLYDSMQPRLEIHLDTLMTRLSIKKSELKKRGLPYVKSMIEDSCRIAQDLGVLKQFMWQPADDGGLELVLDLDPEKVPSMRLPQEGGEETPTVPSKRRSSKVKPKTR